LAKRQGHKWTFNGVKQYYPDLSFEDWLKICAHGNNSKEHISEVVSGRKGKDVAEGESLVG
jgi:hypothetical protein